MADPRLNVKLRPEFAGCLTKAKPSSVRLDTPLYEVLAEGGVLGASIPEGEFDIVRDFVVWLDAADHRKVREFKGTVQADLAIASELLSRTKQARAC